MNVFDRLQSIDRRILYVLIAVVITAPLLIKPSRHPRVVFDEVRNAYELIDRAPDDQLIVMSTVWGAGTLAENGPQTEALMRHMFKRGKKFAVISWNPVGAELSYGIGRDLERELGKKYGRDWVHLGYNPGPIYIIIRGMGTDFAGTLKKDMFGTSLAELPATRGVKNHKQIAAVAEVTPSATVSTWIAYFGMPYNVPIIFCPTAVMAAEAYPFLDSGQIAGMLNGVIGAAQYETMLGMENERTYAAAASWALSSAHIFIIVLVILGNIGYALSRIAGGGPGSPRRRGGSRNA